MSVFAISDPHLPGGRYVNKSMSVFGSRWQDHVARLERSWRAVVTDGDTVVIPGDISWATTLDDAMADLSFLASLPGKKLIGKGNHDFWWSTLSKMRSALTEHGITSIDFIQNNAYEADGLIICGTRGWFADESAQADIFDTDFHKLASREASRLELSIKSGLSLAGDNATRLRVFLHFPAAFGSDCSPEIIEVLTKYSVTEVYFGHIHSPSASPSAFTKYGINHRLISADALGFAPTLVK